MSIIARTYCTIERELRGKCRVSMRFDGADHVRIVLTDANYNPVFSHEWQHGDNAESFTNALAARFKAIGKL